jgi:outer membrane lipoprotein LolB
VKRALAAALVAAGLTGCATQPSAPDMAVISGRLLLQVASQGPQPGRSLGADFELRGDARYGALALSTSLGTTLAQATWRPGGVELVTGDGVYRFDDLTDLTGRMLGEPLPLAALFDWLRARPWPAAPSLPTATGFEQLGWQVDLSRHAEGLVLLHRPQPPAVTLRLRLDAAS